MKKFLVTILATIGATALALGVGAVVLVLVNRPFEEPLNLTEEATANAYIWLSQIEEMPLSYEEVQQCMGEISVTLHYEPAGEFNVYNVTVNDASVTRAKDDAMVGLEKAFKSVVTIKAGADVDVDALIQQVYGLGVADYLSSQDLALIPDHEQLQSRYSGKVSHEFRLARDVEYCRNYEVSVNGGDATKVAGLNYFYPNNAMISLRGLAQALAGSDKAFDIKIQKSLVEIWMPVDGYSQGASLWTPEETKEFIYGTYRINDLYFNKMFRQYGSVIYKFGSDYDCFMSVIDVAMLFDMSVEIRDGVVYIDTTKPFVATPETLEKTGLFAGVNGLIVGDVTTGDVYYSYNEEEDFAIASTTKLMTYLCVMDAVAAGEITLEDAVTITAEAEMISKSDDGVTPMKEGQQVKVKELITGALLPSSNECAYSLAVYVAGSEEAFVQRMNAKATAIGMDSAVYYNSHGLPCYDENLVPAKKQNRASAKDLFTLASYIMANYPQVTEITSQKTAKLPTIGMEVINTNSMLFNLTEAKGLKTGTTNKAGACLVTLLGSQKDGVEHNLVVVELGAEDRIDRNRVSELLCRYAIEALKAGETGDVEDKAQLIPKDPNLVVKRLVAAAGQS